LEILPVVIANLEKQVANWKKPLKETDTLEQLELKRRDLLRRWTADAEAMPERLEAASKSLIDLELRKLELFALSRQADKAKQAEGEVKVQTLKKHEEFKRLRENVKKMDNELKEKCRGLSWDNEVRLAHILRSLL
jgi:hypothetical protein